VGKPTKVTNSIRALRFARGEMTQAELAKRIDVTRQTIIAIEQGRYSPSLEMAFQIAGSSTFHSTTPSGTRHRELVAPISPARGSASPAISTSKSASNPAKSCRAD
jgi:putative transcriptional regulator